MIAFIGNQISEKHMNKRIKWGIILTIGIGLSGLGIYQFTPHENEELTAPDDDAWNLLLDDIGNRTLSA